MNMAGPTTGSIRGNLDHWNPAVALLAAASAARISVFLYCGAPFEDALISLRYARNVAWGRGFVYNAGEQVLGTTTPLWTLINAVYVRLFGIVSLFAFGFWLNLGLDLLTLTAVIAILHRAGQSVGVSLGAVLPLAFFSPFVFITSSNMETSLFVCLGRVPIPVEIEKAYSPEEV